MVIFLPKDVWKNKKGSHFKKSPYPLTLNYHTGQDFFTDPVGTIPIVAPCDGFLKTSPVFSETAGWWGYYKFNHNDETYSLRILHMYKQMKEGEYKKGEILGYCGATGFCWTQKYKKSLIGQSHEEQTSDRAVAHLHVELHKDEFQFNTLKNKALAEKFLIDPISNFEKWVEEIKTREQYKNEGKQKIIEPKKKEKTKKEVNKLEKIIEFFLGILNYLKNKMSKYVKRS